MRIFGTVHKGRENIGKESDKVQKGLPQFCGSPIGKGFLQADFHLNGLLVVQRYDVTLHGLAVHGHAGLAGAPHVHHILGAPELPGDGVFLLFLA